MTAQDLSERGLHRETFAIGLGAGFLTLMVAAAIVFMRDVIRGSEVIETIVNVSVHCLPMLTAAIGAFVAPDRKLFNGVAAGWLCVLPGSIVGVFMLGFVALLLVIPLALAFAVVSAHVFVGAAIGMYASQKVAAAKAQR